jgi:hypothetical protein
MSLSEQERDRIREEELLRLQVAEEFRRQHRASWFTEPRVIGLGVVAVALGGLLFSLMRTV